MQLDLREGDLDGSWHNMQTSLGEGGIWMQLCTLTVMRTRYSNCFYKPGVPKVDRKWPKARGKGGMDKLSGTTSR